MSDGSMERAIQHQQAMANLVEESEYTPIKMLAPKISKDGNLWCCLLGDDIQTGICGFGATPNKAMLAFGRALHCNSGSCEIQ